MADRHHQFEFSQTRFWPRIIIIYGQIDTWIGQQVFSVLLSKYSGYTNLKNQEAYKFLLEKEKLSYQTSSREVH